MLQVRDLTVRYATEERLEITVVRGVNLEIAAGEALGLAGESGSGKSTLALSILRLLPKAGRIAAGSIVFRGRELLALSGRELQKVRGAEISMIFQEAGIALNPMMRVGDQVAEVIRAHRSWDRKRCQAEARAALEQVSPAEVPRIYDAYPHQLSGGQRQRVLIAQAIACLPALVIADEPTTALDAPVQGELLELLGELKRRLRIAFLLISHSPAVLAKLADRIAVMYAGRIAEEGPSERLLHNPLHPYTQGLLECLPKASGPHSSSAGAQREHLLQILGDPPDLANLPPGCPFEPRCPDRREICRTREPQEVSPEPARRVRCFKYGG